MKVVKQVELWEVNKETGDRFLMNEITGTSKFRDPVLPQPEDAHTNEHLLRVAQKQKQGWVINGPNNLTHRYEIVGRFHDGSTVTEKEMMA